MGCNCRKNRSVVVGKPANRPKMKTMQERLEEIKQKMKDRNLKNNNTEDAS